MSETRLPHYAQYYAIRGAVAALDRLSIRRAGRIGEWIGGLGYRPLGIRRAVVERQVRAAFPGLAELEVLRIARASYEHLGRTSIEAALISALSPDQVRAMFERVEGADALAAARAEGKGVLLVSGHLGNWELAGAFVAASGVPIEAVARGMENPLFDRYITRTRHDLGMTVIHDADAVRRVPRAMREGKAVAMLVDQGAVGLASTWVPFFGRYAKTPRGPAVFALRLGAPVVFATALRQPDGKYVMYYERVPVHPTGDREADVDRIVMDYTATLERWIRRAPEQYFWHHRRWKHQRPGTPPELGDPS
ncbi:MAG TPA: lysophospholipid acyltransferase family protein [Gemmatimonadaceae bacterium]|nr:lysophospholipid acyltransferase family protein [Gemmatimonadaceae bacterium]